MTTGDGCPVCGADALGPAFTVRERMQGTGAPFDYRECCGCGSLSIAGIPGAQVLAAAYGPGYYAHVPRSGRGWRDRVQALRDRLALGAPGPVARLVLRLKPEPLVHALAWAGIGPRMRVLDVGCGRGALLDRLARAGFARLMGADPFVPEGTRTPAGVPVAARAVEALEPGAGPFDAIMFHHSLEHVPDPVATPAGAAARLAPGGRVLVRVPVPDSEAFARHGPDWVQLDAPRHLVLPSRAGMARLAARAGLRLVASRDDSTGFGLWGSELYRRGVPLAPGGAIVRPGEHFTAAELAGWEAEARRLNAARRGDQACFLLLPA